MLPKTLPSAPVRPWDWPASPARRGCGATASTPIVAEGVGGSRFALDVSVGWHRALVERMLQQYAAGWRGANSGSPATLVLHKTAEGVGEVFCAQGPGVLNLERHAGGLDFFWVVVNQRALGNIGQPHEEANRFMDGSCESRERQVEKGLRHGRSMGRLGYGDAEWYRRAARACSNRLGAFCHAERVGLKALYQRSSIESEHAGAYHCIDARRCDAAMDDVGRASIAASTWRRFRCPCGDLDGSSTWRLRFRPALP